MARCRHLVLLVSLLLAAAPTRAPPPPPPPVTATIAVTVGGTEHSFVARLDPGADGGDGPLWASARAFCRSVGLGTADDGGDRDRADDDSCASQVARSVDGILAARREQVQTLSDVTSRAVDLAKFRDVPGACTDDFHASGRCMLMRALTNYVLKSYVPGDYVEAGVHVGDSAASVAQVFVEARATKRMFLYDSWEGMPAAEVGV